VSPDKKARAFVEVEATALQSTAAENYVGSLCRNVSKLYVVSDQAGFGQPRYVEKPGKPGQENVEGNSLRIVDWSPDGKWLLVDMKTWIYQSEGWSNFALLYSLQSGTTKQFDLQKLFTNALKKECAVFPEIMGFTSSGEIILEVAPVGGEDDEELFGESCFRSRSFWTVNSKSEIKQIAQPPTIRRNGQWQEPPGKRQSR
jgi:hypothetical protein